ncbi:MAG: hypothetical protein H0W86_11295 [Armatimonadetes bacterium]|nr:hypothetical protein [Armatimonadota bacterium]
MKRLSVCISGLVCSIGLAEVPQWSVTQSDFVWEGMEVALSPQREVYVQVNDDFHPRIDKYDATGTLVWSRAVWDGYPLGLKATRDGGVLSQSNYSQKGGGGNFTVFKISPSGATEWLWGFADDFRTSSAEDHVGDVYFGRVNRLDKVNGITGVVVWQKVFTAGNLAYPAVDSANRCVLVVGTHRYVFAPDGTELQHTQLPIAGPTYNGGVGVAIDEADNLFVGNASGQYGKFDPSGQTIFTGLLGNEIVYVSLFKDEALLTYWSPGQQGGTLMSKLAANGTVLWTKLGVNTFGDIYRPAFVARFDTLGGVIGGGGFQGVVMGKYRAQNGNTWYSQTIDPGRYAAIDVDRSGNFAIANREEWPSSGYTVEFYAGGIEHAAATLNRGTTTENSHYALHNSSDGYWRIRPGAVFSNQQAPAENPASMSVVIESRATSAAIRQNVSVYNFSTATWTLIESVSGLPTGGAPDRYATISVPNPVQHVGSQREIKVKVEYRADGPIFAYPWTVSIDRELVKYTRAE